MHVCDLFVLLDKIFTFSLRVVSKPVICFVMLQNKSTSMSFSPLTLSDCVICIKGHTI